MSVDLSDYIEHAQVAIPVTLTDDQWVLALANAFWEAYLNGHFRGYREADGLIEPRTVGDPDLERDQVQLIIIYARYVEVRSELLRLKTKLRVKSGPTEYESERSANVLSALLKELAQEMKDLKDDLLNRGVTCGYAWDAVLARDESLLYGDNYFVN